MKNLPVTLVVIMTFMTVLGCEKEPPEAILPEEVAFGESVVFLNGKEVDYLPFLGYQAFNHVMNYSFGQSKNQGQLINSLGFGGLPYNTGEFEITSDDAPYIKAEASFNQTISEDLRGYEYDLVDEDEGFFIVEHLGTINLEVKGRFKAKFCRTSKNGNKHLGLPKHLVFQGVFYENYIIY